jgi:hypothetical protein
LKFGAFHLLILFPDKGEIFLLMTISLEDFVSGNKKNVNLIEDALHAYAVIGLH